MPLDAQSVHGAALLNDEQATRTAATRTAVSEEVVDTIQIVAHELKPVIAIGAGGLTDSLIKQVQRELARHELVRVRIPYGNRERRERILAELLPRTDTVLVRRCGYEAWLHRPCQCEQAEPDQTYSTAAIS